MYAIVHDYNKIAILRFPFHLCIFLIYCLVVVNGASKETTRESKKDVNQRFVHIEEIVYDAFQVSIPMFPTVGIIEEKKEKGLSHVCSVLLTMYSISPL